MRLLWLSHFFPYPPAGGALQRSYHLLSHAASAHEVHLVALSKSRNRPSANQVNDVYPHPEEFCERVDCFDILSEKTPFHRAWVIGKGLFSEEPYDVRWLRSPELKGFLQQLESPAGGFDLIHVDTIGLAQYGRLLSETPVVLNHHNIESHMMERRSNGQSGPIRRVYLAKEAEKLKRLEADYCQKVAVNLVVSDLERERLLGVCTGASVEVIPNGVDVDYFRPNGLGKLGDEEGLIFVGRMSWYPNKDAVVWFLREIWPLLVRNRSDRTMTFVGSSPPALVSEYRNVSAPGFVPDVRPYMNRAQIYVCPIRTGGGTRLKILDAMAMGMPLVATSMSVEGLGLTEGEHYLRADEPEEFERAIRRLETDHQLRARLSENARGEAITRYSWSKISDNLAGAYARATA